MKKILLFKDDSFCTMVSSWTEELYCYKDPDGTLCLQESKSGEGERDWFSPICGIENKTQFIDALNGLENIYPPDIDREMTDILGKLDKKIATEIEKEYFDI